MAKGINKGKYLTWGVRVQRVRDRYVSARKTRWQGQLSAYALIHRFVAKKGDGGDKERKQCWEGCKSFETSKPALRDTPSSKRLHLQILSRHLHHVVSKRSDIRMGAILMKVTTASQTLRAQWLFLELPSFWNLGFPLHTDGPGVTAKCELCEEHKEKVFPY